jgi:hypothetical protein
MYGLIGCDELHLQGITLSYFVIASLSLYSDTELESFLGYAMIQ